MENQGCTQDSDCAAGLACGPSNEGGSQQCEKTCSTNADCTTPGGYCLDLPNETPGTVCTPNCDPLTNTGCLSGDSCRLLIVGSHGSHALTYCGATGTKGEGHSCTENDSCQVGFECDNGECMQFCDPNNDMCPAPYSCYATYTLGNSSTMIGECE